MFAILYIYKLKNINNFLILPVKFGIKVIIPCTLFIAGILGYNKDSIRSFFIELNNIFVQSQSIKYKTGEGTFNITPLFAKF